MTDAAARTEEQMLTRFRSGEQAAYRHFFERHFGAMVYYAQAMLGQRTEAEDVAQEVFYQLWQHREEFNSVEHVKGFLYKSTRFGCINRLRQRDTQERHHAALVERANSDAFSDSLIVREELFQAVINEINALPEKYATILRLRYLQDLDYGEIATQLGTSEATIRKQKQRALEMLQTVVVKKKLLSAAGLIMLLQHLHR